MQFDMTSEQIIASMKEHVLPKFISEKRKKELKDKDTLFVPWLDLTICFYLPLPELSEPDRSACALLTRSLFRKLEMTEEDLLASAVRHLSDEVLLLPFSEILRQLSENFQNEIPFLDEGEDSSVPAWFVSNIQRSFGAAALLCESTRARLHGELGPCFCILPSSVHEVLCLPCDNEEDAVRFSSMVREINESCVDPCERLSDHVYLCRNGVVGIADPVISSLPARSSRTGGKSRRPQYRRRPECCPV
ncbi:MAG: DUF5688 family protein [Lachnospiraceae bacterium]|nr:DUF5688 family protein [Lachnospiraceae bacterium]